MQPKSVKMISFYCENVSVHASHDSNQKHSTRIKKGQISCANKH